MNNIIIVKLDSTYVAVYSGIWQWNYGQILRIQGGNLPKVVEVHFSLQDKGGDSITRIGTTVDGATDVPIPDSFLENGGRAQDYKIYAFIYLEDGTAGNTEYKIEMSVKSRPKPEVPGTPEEPELFRETVKAVNDAANRAAASEQNAKASATEAGKYAASASKSAVAAEKTKEDALRKVGEKKQEAIEAIQEQEETSAGKIVNHTDNEIKRIQNQTAESKGGLEQTITNAGVSKEELDESIQTASDTKTALDKSVELAGTAKTESDASTQKAGEAKTALDGSAKTAGDMQETLNATVKQAGALDTSLGEKIKTGTQLKTDLVASGEKAVQDIQAAGSEQLGKMQAVAEEFTADREQINVNKEDISILKEEMGKNYLDDAKTKRSLDALWILNQGISYQFETDAEKAYQKDIPSGAKLASVKKIGGRTIVWNQLATNIASNWNFESSNSATVIEEEDYMSSTIKTSSSHILWERYNNNRFAPILGQKYYVTINVFLPKKANVHYRTYGYEVSRKSIEANIWYTYSDIISPQKGNDSGKPFSIIFSSYNDNTFESGDKFMFKNIMVFDLTKMFGAGNEPSTPEEFEAMFPKDYYPYNEGTLMSIPVNEVRNRGYSNIDISEFARAYPDKCNFSDGVLHILSANTSLFFRGIPVTAKTGDKLTVDIKCGTATNVRLRARLKTGVETDITSGVNDTEWNHRECVLSVDIVALMLNWLTAGTFSIRNLCVNGKPYYCEEYPIPQAILDLDGYGDGVSDDVYNYVDWEEKKYHKRVGRVDLGSLTYTNNGTASDGAIQWKSKEKISKKEVSYACMCPVFVERRASGTIVPITNGICDLRDDCSISLGYIGVTNDGDFAKAMQGVMLYYELAEEQIIDISDIIDSTFQEPIEVEAGGTLTFQNSNGDGYRLPIPNEEEYIVSLAEVGGGASE